MPQLQLPIFPAGAAEINHQIAVEKKDGMVYYIHGFLPVFGHREDDVRAFRMFSSQMIVSGTVKPREVVQAFEVPMVTVKRYVKVLRERGSEGFYVSAPRHSSASVLKGEVLERAQQLLAAGRSVGEVAGEVQVLANTLHKAYPRRPVRKRKSHRPARDHSAPRASAVRSIARRRWVTPRRDRWSGWRRRWRLWAQRRLNFSLIAM